MIEQQNSLAEKFIKKWFWLYLFTFIIAPIWYIAKIIITWIIPVEQVWILYWIISLITLISAYNDLWITESLNYFIPKYITEKRYDKVKTILVYALIAQMITWISIALIWFFWAEYIAENYFKSKEATDSLKIFSFFFILANIFHIITNFFMAIQDTFNNKFSEFIRMISILIFVFSIFLLDFWNLTNFSYTWLFWLFFWLIFSFIIFYKKYYKIYLKTQPILWDKKLFKTIFKYALVVFLWAQASVVLSQIDMLIIISMLWNRDAWYYTTYLSIINIPFMLIWPIFWLLFPIFSEMHSKNDYSKIKMIKELFTNNFLIIWIWFNILFFVFAEIIAFILFWEEFRPSWTILRYSILFLIFNFLLSINFNIMAWIWKIKERVKIITIAVIFNFITNILFIKLFQYWWIGWVNWSAVATWLWWILIWIMSENILWKEYNIKYNFKTISKNIVAMWIIWILSYNFILPIINWYSRTNSLIIMLIYIVFYFFLFTIVNKKEFNIFVWEIKKFRKKS